ncbi:hypothetical protein K0U83_22970 [bacterium]|nr:hypothetical protein [bacterium]
MKSPAFLLLSTLSIAALTTSNGCSSVNGFRSLSDGQAATPELRKAAATARAEADALDAIADQQSEQLRQAVDGAHGLAESLGAPELVTGLIAGLGGLLVPSPIRRKKKPTE